MKIQCSCGTKYSFDLTPEMARAPITFVCQNCGADSSQMVNQLIRHELGVGAPSPASGDNPPRHALAPPPTREAVIVHVHTPAAVGSPAPPVAPQAQIPAKPAPVRATVPKPASDAAPANEAPAIA